MYMNRSFPVWSPRWPESQFERVRELADDAKDNGATIDCGRAPMPRVGYFYVPTIASDITEGIRLVDEEQFGPASPTMSFRDVDNALERANRTHFGLGGSIWTADVDAGPSRQVESRAETAG